jgi:hypothetical protein
MTRRFLATLTRAPLALATTMSRIGVDSLDQALRDARPLATRDHSATTVSILGFFRSQRASLVHPAPTGGHHFYPDSWGFWGCPCWSETWKKTSTTPAVNSYEINFEFTNRERSVISFGAPAALGFHGVLPKYVCPAAPRSADVPTVGLGPADAQPTWGVAPTCDARDAGADFHYSGMLAKLQFPARSVWTDVGANRAIPGGLAVQFDGFDANGALVVTTAVLVASSTNGDHAWTDHRLTLAPPLHTSRPIVFVALYVNHALSSVVGADSPDLVTLAADKLGYEERAR